MNLKRIVMYSQKGPEPLKNMIELNNVILMAGSLIMYFTLPTHSNQLGS